MAPQNELVVPIDARDVNSFLSAGLFAVYDLLFGDAAENQVQLDEVPCDEDQYESADDTVSDQHSA